MIIGIMQPYFMPYIGYWQLMNAVDKYVVYDNIEFTKKGWFNRNRILLNGKDFLFSIPIKNDSDYLHVNQRFVSETFDKQKLLSQIRNAYSKAPYFKTIFPIIESIIMLEEENLFKYIFNSIKAIHELLDIKSELIVSSSISIDHALKGKDKVLAICKNLNADSYYNAIGGNLLYNKNEFEQHNIELNFIKTRNIEYKQYSNEFIPNLSIIDVLMFNSLEEIKKVLNEFDLI